MIEFKSNEEITENDIDQIHNYTISLYDEITNGGYNDVDKTRVKNRIRHLIEIVEKNNKMKTSKQRLTEAMEFHKEILRFFAKNYTTYINELEKYAENHGFHERWDAMIRELQND